MLKALKRIIFKPRLSREALEAYFFRLPNAIQVSWFRDGKFIVGKVNAGEHEFMTQGKNADDFMNMVNDAIYAVEDIPEDYIDVIQKMRTYKPPATEEAKLRNNQVANSVMALNKQEEVLRMA